MKEIKKGINVVAYFLFFIPLIVDGENEQYRFHANQGLNLWIVIVITAIAGYFIPVIGWFLILPIGGVVNLILLIKGINNALNGKMRELPFIGKYKLIK